VTAKTARILKILFVAYVVATAVHLMYVIAHEPFGFDAWNVAVDTGAKPFSFGRFLAFWHQQYTSSNPRIGQPMAYFAYKLGGVTEVGTTIAYFAIVVSGFILGVGRWPSRRSGKDLATLAIGIGFVWFAVPSFGAYMFSRAYATNYVWAAAIQLGLLAALRLHRIDAPSGIGKLVVMLVIGVIAGMCNEHTGPTLLVAIVAYLVWNRRAHGVHVRIGYAAALGVIAGYALLFFAPGQSQRYEGLAEKYSVVQQIFVRGVSGNLEIFQGLLFCAAPVLLIVLAMVAIGSLARRGELAPDVRQRQRAAVLALLVALLAATLITATVMASPKLGPRFYMHAMLGVLAGVMAIARAYLDSPRAFAPFVILAVFASGYAAARTVPSYTHYKRDADQRLTELAAMPAHGVYTADAWDQVSETWWFLGDDFRDQKKREMVARYFGLDRVLFRGSDVWTALGVADVKLQMHYHLEPELCLDEVDKLELKPYIGRDIAALHHAFLDAVTEIERTAPAHLRSIDLVATFLGEAPPLPRPQTYVARWRDGAVEAFTASLGRAGRSKDRTIRLADDVTAPDWDVYVVAIGDKPRLLGKTRDRQFTYQPWRTGQYWVLVCDQSACFVTMAMHHRI
jgi:hypothetical protein